jgi:putative FmdB family regulatory protein
MPLYDFVCRACGHEFEALVRGPEAPECPECHGTDLERLLSSFVASSEEGRQKAAQASRQQQIRGRRDQLVAEAEYRKQHEH